MVRCGKNWSKQNMYKPKNEDITFYMWMIDNWTITGGLITQIAAARLLCKSKGRIKQIIDEGKLKEYRFQNMSFVSYPEVMKLARQLGFEKAKKTLNKEFQEVSGIMPEDMKELPGEILKLIDNLEKITDQSAKK